LPARKQFNGGLDVSSVGTYVAHALPGSYKIWVRLATGSSSGTTTADAATSSGNKDSAFSLPDLACAASPC